MAAFAGAKLIVGEFGSALHNAIFSPKGTTVLGMNHINSCQTRIAQLRRHRIGYILPADGPLGFDRSLSSVRRGYRINAGEFASRLDANLSIEAIS